MFGRILDIIPGWRYISAGVALVVFFLVAWWAAKTWVIPPSDLPDEEESALEQACADLARQIGTHMAETDRGLLNIAIADVRGDTSNGQILLEIEDALEEDPRFEVKSNDLIEDIDDAVERWLEGGQKPTPEEVLTTQGELDACLFVNLTAKHTGSREANVRLKADLYEWTVNKDGARQRIAEIPFIAEGMVPVQRGDEGGGFWDDFWWALWRSVMSVVGALTIPFLFLPVTDWVMKKNSNAFGFAYLGMVVLFALVPWYVLLVADARGGTPTALVFGFFLLALTAVWTYKMHDAWSERIH